ncbi:alpha-hydroxy-acid oxidizing protein [Roseibacterium beibuensis]|uniref:Alpha-hydroxy acid oxidase n=1 Tax=[Roseibacterium] beibuensis TaxID=1193142 RepID=A0ABP9KWH4_9RHOB|nr:alpha-hydroxy acid oxidase [Roseibacterium beibuensis]MCS6621897.1 alpha-hydroxy-acid oxidizing protein [Roseibacterium beibuensis]
MDLHSRFPALSDLKARARRRIPHFVWEYLDSATGSEKIAERNRAALDKVLFRPAALRGEITPDLSTTLFGEEFPVPFGIAPLGMSGLIWPEAERILARHAARAGIPYTLSTVATRTPDELKGQIGDHGWFQMYPPKSPEIRDDMLRRAREAGFRALVLTVDVPAASRRERQTRGGLVQPPRLTPRLLLQVARCPAWALGIQASGMPRMRLMDSYADQKKTGPLPSTAHVGYLLRAAPDWDYVAALREKWDGPLILKGVMEPEVAIRAAAEGVDAVWVSNHAGRQFDGAPASIDVLPEIRSATDLPILFDSGIEGGLDIMRALATGADFVMMGRPWHYALGALGRQGPSHLHDILAKDMVSNMAQIGAQSLDALAARGMQPAD